MDRVPGESLTRRQLMGLTAAAAGSLGGCQTVGRDDAGGGTGRETVTPAAVPADALASRVELRHDRAPASPTAAAIDQLLTAFADTADGVTAVDGRLGDDGVDDREPDGDTAVVTYDRIGANLAPRTGRLRSLDDLWDASSDVYPHGVTVSSYVDRVLAVVPQTVHLMNCLYYNPQVLSDAGVTPDEYATVSDLQATPGPLAESVETLFAQPLRSATDLLELWESLLGSRLYRQRQYIQYVSGHVDTEPLPIKRATRDFDAALSMLPDGVEAATPASLLDGVVDGSIGFVRQPTWASRHLRERSDAVYGTDWAVAPLFASPWTVVFVADGFSVPTVSTGATGRTLIEFATAREQQRRFCETAGAIPARTDVSVEHHPLFAEQAADYREASVHLPSMAHGIAVEPPVRRRLETALAAFRSHRDVERAIDELITTLRTANPL